MCTSVFVLIIRITAWYESFYITLSKKTHRCIKEKKQQIRHHSVPLEEQLYHLWGISESSVRGEEDAAIVLLLAARVKEVIHKQVQGSSLQAAHFGSAILDKGTALTLFIGGRGGDRLPPQGDPINCTLLILLTPFLHWVLGMAEAEKCV